MKKFVTIASALALMAAMGTAQADGKATYTQSCNACHGSGVAGAPKFGDAAAWKDRIAKGKETLYKHAIEGFKGSTGFMPPKGGWANLTDDQVKAAVDYIIAGSQ